MDPSKIDAVMKFSVPKYRKYVNEGFHTDNSTTYGIAKEECHADMYRETHLVIRGIEESVFAG